MPQIFGGGRQFFTVAQCVVIDLRCMIQLHTSPRGLVPMSNDGKRVRSWQDIAAEASRERDPKKREELAIELKFALDLRGRTGKSQPALVNGRQQSA
jgi:hypothetical protein